jgi:hypothetical protein
MAQDDRELKDIDLDELLRRARGGTLRHLCSQPMLELRRWRGFLVGQAEDLVRTGAGESRALKQDEDRAVGQFIDGARELRVLIEELEAAYRKELADPANLVLIGPK